MTSLASRTQIFHENRPQPCSSIVLTKSQAKSCISSLLIDKNYSTDCHQSWHTCSCCPAHLDGLAENWRCLQGPSTHGQSPTYDAEQFEGMCKNLYSFHKWHSVYWISWHFSSLTSVQTWSSMQFKSSWKNSTIPSFVQPQSTKPFTGWALHPRCDLFLSHKFGSYSCFCTLGLALMGCTRILWRSTSKIYSRNWQWAPRELVTADDAAMNILTSYYEMDGHPEACRNTLDLFMVLGTSHILRSNHSVDDYFLDILCSLWLWQRASYMSISKWAVITVTSFFNGY